MNDPLLVVLTVFVAVSAIALCIQAGLLFGIYKATTKSARTGHVADAAGYVRPWKAETTIDESRKNIAEITARANEIAAKANELMDMGKVQMAKLDAVLADASQRAKVQLERAELVWTTR